MNSSTRKHATRKSLRPLFIGVFVLAVVLAILIPVYLLGSRMMDAAQQTQTPQQLALASPGSLVKIAVEVTSLPSSTMIQAKVLQANGDGSYTHTNQTVQVQWNPGQGIVMGSSTDVKPGAVLQISGKMGENQVLTADQLVVLTNVARLK